MPLGEDIREFPARLEAERQIGNLLERGVQLQLIYTGGMIDCYSYERQVGDMFPTFRGHSKIRLRYAPKLDHLATLAEDREELLTEVEHWLSNLRHLVDSRT